LAEQKMPSPALETMQVLPSLLLVVVLVVVVVVVVLVVVVVVLVVMFLGAQISANSNQRDSTVGSTVAVSDTHAEALHGRTANRSCVSRESGLPQPSQQSNRWCWRVCVAIQKGASVIMRSPGAKQAVAAMVSMFIMSGFWHPLGSTPSASSSR
jgi:hypothetical protein